MATDIKQYWQELAKKAGLSDEMAKPVLEALGQEAVAKAFNEGFKPMPDYSRDLDGVRDRTKVETAAAVKAQYDEWYQRTALPAYQEHLKAVELTKKYQETYGPLDSTNPNPGNNGNAAHESVFTKKEFEEAMAAKLQAWSSDLLTVNRHSLDYYHRFKEPLDVGAVAKFAQEKGIASVDEAYRQYTAPKTAEIEKTALEARIKSEREEAVRDYASKHQLPVAPRARDPHPLFDRTAVKDGTDPERASRDAFMEGWSKAQENPAA